MKEIIKDGKSIQLRQRGSHNVTISLAQVITAYFLYFTEGQDSW